MRDLSQEKVWTFTDETTEGSWSKCSLRKSQGTSVDNYIALAAKIAALQFHNPNYVLLFRGQSVDYRLPGYKTSTIRPSIFRRDDGHRPKQWNQNVKDRYQKLEQAEVLLTRDWPTTEGKRRLTRSSVIKWAILQHYEVCDTPLLDVTHSLRIAASFASLNNDTTEAYLMVLALPQISGAVTSCAYHELQTLRLSSICPPSAARPHLQEGYLIGEYPELRTHADKMGLALHETDFGKRLIGKLKFNPQTFWKGDAFPIVPQAALYPDSHDELYDLCQSIKGQLDD